MAHKAASFKSTPLISWTTSDVGVWLDKIGLGEYKPDFSAQLITGTDLLDITDADLVELGVSKIIKRKLLRRHLNEMKKTVVEEFGGEEEGEASDSDSNSNSHSSAKQPSVIKLKCYYRKDIRVFPVKMNTKFKKVVEEIRGDYNRTLFMYYTDQEGDLIKIASDRQFLVALSSANDGVLRVTLQRKSKAESSSSKKKQGTILDASETLLLDSLLDACIVISSDAYIEYFSPSAEKTFGYTKKEVLGKNVNILMPGMYAARHDSYIQNYFQTGSAKVIGKARQVVGKHKDGRNLSLELSVSETKTSSRHTFTGMLKMLQGNESSSVDESKSFSIFESLLEPVLCISPNGIIKNCNKKASEFFKYEVTDLVGQNISMLMPNPHRDNHNYYLAQYAKTGKTTVIGKTRDTVCELGDGTILPIRLSVTESTLSDGGKQFVGTISERVTAAPSRKVSKLVQQRQVIDSLATPAIIIDSNATIQAFNQSACKILGYKIEEMMGQNVNLVVGGSHAPSHDSYVQNYLRTGITKVIGKDRRLHAKAKDGKEIRILLSVTETRNDDGTVFFTGMFFQD